MFLPSQKCALPQSFLTTYRPGWWSWPLRCLHPLGFVVHYRFKAQPGAGRCQGSLPSLVAVFGPSFCKFEFMPLRTTFVFRFDYPSVSPKKPIWFTVLIVSAMPHWPCLSSPFLQFSSMVIKVVLSSLMIRRLFFLFRECCRPGVIIWSILSAESEAFKESADHFMSCFPHIKRFSIPTSLPRYLGFSQTTWSWDNFRAFTLCVRQPIVVNQKNSCFIHSMDRWLASWRYLATLKLSHFWIFSLQYNRMMNSCDVVLP